MLSGSIVQTNDIMLAAVREAVYGASHPLVTRDLRIIRSQMGSSAGLVGAARVAAELLFAPGFLKEWVMQGSPLLHPGFVAFRAGLDTAPPPPPAIPAPQTRCAMTISGLGPHGERAAPPERVTLLPEDRAAAKARGYRVAVVMHTLESDWARQQLSGMVGTFGDCGTAVTHVVDCAFSPRAQVGRWTSLLLNGRMPSSRCPSPMKRWPSPMPAWPTPASSWCCSTMRPTGLLPGQSLRHAGIGRQFRPWQDRGRGSVAASAARRRSRLARLCRRFLCHQ